MRQSFLIVIIIFVIGSVIFVRAEDTQVSLPITPKIEMKDDPDTIFVSGKETLVYYSKVLDSPPVFIPSGIRGIMQFLSHNIKYSSSCYQPEGRVIAKCLISAEGTVESVEIIQSLDKHEDNEVARLLPLMTFTPAILDGRPVASWFFFPITFKMADE
ncbi:MAG: energy transducer TonB [Muribaculaceae bacterium]|nr:energy transducer TonB [Muribaculaceae bacterium]